MRIPEDSTSVSATRLDWGLSYGRQRLSCCLDNWSQLKCLTHNNTAISYQMFHTLEAWAAGIKQAMMFNYVFKVSCPKMYLSFFFFSQVLRAWGGSTVSPHRLPRATSYICMSYSESKPRVFWLLTEMHSSTLYNEPFRNTKFQHLT